MLVVDSLAADAERLRDVAPGPAEAAGVVDVELFELVQAVAKRRDRRESGGGLLALLHEASEVDDASRHAGTLSSAAVVVNQR